MLTTALKAQITSNELVGNWNVLDVIIEAGANTSEKKAVALVRPSLKKGSFSLKSDHSGRFYLPYGDFDIQGDQIPSDHIYWDYDEKKSYLIIYEARNKKSRLGQFYVRRRGNDIYFVLDEVPAALRVGRR